jgi:hypothetical protein
MFSRSVIGAALALAALGASAQSIKPGLWEMSNKMGGNPQMEQAMAEMQKQMAAMPPAQRKQMEEAMAKQGVKMGGAGAGGALTAQVCITKEMAERNEMPVNQAGCKITSQSKSGNVTKMAYACTNPPSSGEGTYTYHSAEAFSSKMVVRTAVQGRTETMTMDGSGKWLKADCGNVKPIQPPGK